MLYSQIRFNVWRHDYWGSHWRSRHIYLKPWRWSRGLRNGNTTSKGRRTSAIVIGQRWVSDRIPPAHDPVAHDNTSKSGGSAENMWRQLKRPRSSTNVGFMDMFDFISPRYLVDIRRSILLHGRGNAAVTDYNGRCDVLLVQQLGWQLRWAMQIAIEGGQIFVAQLLLQECKGIASFINHKPASVTCYTASLVNAGNGYIGMIWFLISYGAVNNSAAALSSLLAQKSACGRR